MFPSSLVLEKYNRGYKALLAIASKFLTSGASWIRFQSKAILHISSNSLFAFLLSVLHDLKSREMETHFTDNWARLRR
jgi:hypothetical protein